MWCIFNSKQTNEYKFSSNALLIYLRGNILVIKDKIKFEMFTIHYIFTHIVNCFLSVELRKAYSDNLIGNRTTDKEERTNEEGSTWKNWIHWIHCKPKMNFRLIFRSNK